MNLRLVVLTALALAASIFIILAFLRPGDIREDIEKAEDAVLSVLQAEGITNDDLLFREEKDWIRSGTRGKTFIYVFGFHDTFKISGLDERLKERLKGVRGVHLNRFFYRRGDGKEKSTARFDIAHGDRIVLSVILKNVLPAWMKGGAEKPRVTGKRVPASPGEDLSLSSEGRQSSYLQSGMRDLPGVALVLDDFGYTKRNLAALKDVGVPLTVAVLPNTPYSKAVCSFARENDLEVILHLPMEPENKTNDMEKDTIKGDMDDTAIREIIASALDSVPSANGVSNHMGSKATKDSRLMAVVFDELKKREMFFLDSLTTEASVCKRVAQKMGVPYVERDIFIDNKLEKKNIRQQMEKVERMVSGGSRVVAVGHDRKVTVETLREVIPKMKEKGIRFMSLSEMIQQPGE